MHLFNWRPGIGDPSIMGWVTVCLYLLCAIGAFLLCSRTHRYFSEQQSKQKQFWLFLCVVLTLLGINKQLDLQSFMTELGRYIAHKQGWYDYRRIIQRQFIYAVIAVGCLTLLAVLILFKSIVRRNVFAILGLAVVIVFVLVRASSFHHMDVFINTSVMGLKMNWILELGGLSLIWANILYLNFRERI